MICIHYLLMWIARRKKFPLNMKLYYWFLRPFLNSYSIHLYVKLAKHVKLVKF